MKNKLPTNVERGKSTLCALISMRGIDRVHVKNGFHETLFVQQQTNKKGFSVSLSAFMFYFFEILFILLFFQTDLWFYCRTYIYVYSKHELLGTIKMLQFSKQD
jgi:hypothetical protein